MKQDAAATAALLINGMINNTIEGLHVSFPCKVISFDVAKCTAVVQPLLRIDGIEQAVIQGVPVLGQRLIVDGIEKVYKPSLHPGDAVLVVCCDQEIKNALNGQLATPSSKRMHNQNDILIVGVLPCSL